MGRLSQLSIFLWKNLYVQKVKRHYLLTASELVIALVAFAMVERDRPLPPTNATGPPYLAPASVYEQMSETELEHPRELLYAPETTEVTQLVHEAFKKAPGVELHGYANHDAMNTAFYKMAPVPERGPDQHVVTLLVESLNDTHLQYVIGFYDNGNLISRRHKNQPVFHPLPDPVTQRVTVARIQIALNRAHRKAVLAKHGGTKSRYRVVSERLPQGPHPFDSESRRYFMAVRFCLAFVLPFCVFVLLLVGESQSGLKEYLRLMGMHDISYWLGHFLTALVFGMVTSVVILLYMSFVPQQGQAFLDGTSKTVVLFCFLLFCAQYATVGMFLSLFFTHTLPALAFSLCFWVSASVVPCLTLEDWDGCSAHYLLLSGVLKKASTLVLPCMGPHWCFRIIGCANLVGDPYGWDSVPLHVLKLDHVTMLDIWICMVANIVLNLTLIWYFSNVLPWAKGVPRPPWFPLTVRYWFPAKAGKYEKLLPVTPDGVRFEADPLDAEAAVFVNRLALEKDQVFVLHESSFKTFPGEITVVLGPVSCGKTALIKAIAGLLPPTSGQVIVCGFDIAEDTRSARRELGYCQKKDILLYDLTVQETLMMFGMMRDMGGEQLQKRVKETQELVGLSGDLGSALASALQPRQRRFLAIATAVVATPRVLVLDHPAFGLDATDRDALWGILNKVKAAGPTSIIVATSDLDAEDFADRIAILGYGILKCHGSRTFVRKRFGCGYNIRLMKKRRAFQAKESIDVAKAQVPGAEVLSDHKDAMVLGLGEHVPSKALSAVIRTYEKDYTKLGISNFVLSVTSMDDVFIRLVMDIDYNPRSMSSRPFGREGMQTLTQRHGSRRMSLATGLGDDYEVSGENVVIATQKYIAGMSSQDEYYESQVQIEAHVKELCDLKPGRPSIGQVFKALLAKRAFYTRQTWALPLFCWLLPTALLFWLCTFEKTARVLRGHTVRVSPDNIVYNLGEVYPEARVFLAYDEPSLSATEALYLRLAKNDSADVTIVRNVTQFLRKLAEERVSKEYYLLGAQFVEDKAAQRETVIAFYYGDSYHTQAISLNLAHTALLRLITNDSNATVTAVLRPLRSDVKKRDSVRIANNYLSDVLSSITTERAARLMALPFASSTVLAGFVFFPIDERATRAKTMQLLSGVSPLAYWLSNYVWDLVVAAIFLLCAFFPIFLCHPGAVHLVGHITVLTVAYIHSAVPLVYFFSFVTNSMTAGFLVLVALLAFTGVSSTLGFQFVMMGEEQGGALLDPVIRDPLLYVLYLIPPFSYHWSLVNVVQLQTENWLCSHSTLLELHDMCSFIQGSNDDAAVMLTGLRYCCAELFHNNMTYLTTLDWLSFHRDSAAVELLVMLFQGVIFMVILVTVERGVLRPLITTRSGPSPVQELEPDVLEERRLVEKVVADRDFSKFALTANDLQKRYGRKKALRGLSFLVQPGECVVMLGLRGCGKSALLEVLAGIVAPSAGSAYMPDASLADLEKWQQRIGVCPEFDGVLGKLTVRQTLWLYANLRGIQPAKVDQLVSHVIELLNLRFYDNAYVYACNAATRRKLTVGIAIVGLPPLVLMDDPATGLDLLAKKKIYDTIRLIRQLVNSAVVVVTHSMNDCMAISDRVGVLVKGKLTSIGSSRDVEARICKGSQLTLHFLPEQLKDAAVLAHADTTVKIWFPGATLTANIQNRILEYAVELKRTWSEMLRLLDDLKKQAQAQDVEIGEMTIEHVMLRTARRVRPNAVVRI